MTVLVCDFLGDEFLREILSELLGESGAPVSHIITYKNYNFLKSYENLKIIDANHLANLNFLKKNNPDIDFSFILNWDSSELNEVLVSCGYCLDRTDPLISSNRVKRLHLYSLICYFEELFNKNSEITSVLFCNTPHMAWDLVAFFVAKRRRLRTLFLRRTGIGGYIYLDHDYRSKFTDTSHRYNSTDINNFNKIFKSISFEQLAKISFTANQIDGGWRGQENIGSSLKQILASIGLYELLVSLKRIFEPVPRPPESMINETGQKSIFAFTPSVNRIEYYIFVYKYLIYLKKIKRTYQALCSFDASAMLMDKYVYLPMQMQPERTTDPEAGHFSDQAIVINAVARKLPSGWKLYVKEHPRQFGYDFRNYNARSEIFYKLISDIPSVVLVPEKFSQKTLIQNSKICVSINGSVGWDALLHRKPSILFSKNWHSMCESSIYVETDSELSEALELCCQLSPDDVEERVMNFVRKNLDFLVFGCLNKNHVANFIDNGEYQNMKNSLTQALLERL